MREGTTLRREVQQLKMEMARQQLEENPSSLSEIAFVLGYSDLTAFLHAFKNSTGLTPAQFRQRRQVASTKLPHSR
jgi:AraC family transcriptional regulator